MRAQTGISRPPLGRRDAHDAARHARARVARRQRELVAALAEVVLAAEDDDRPPDDRVGADELHVPILDVHAAGAVLGHLQIAEVAGHPLLVVRAAVVPREGIKDATRARKTLAEITKNVDVDAVEPRRQAADGAVDDGGLGLKKSC